MFVDGDFFDWTLTVVIFTLLLLTMGMFAWMTVAEVRRAFAAAAIREREATPSHALQGRAALTSMRDRVSTAVRGAIERSSSSGSMRSGTTVAAAATGATVSRAAAGPGVEFTFGNPLRQLQRARGVNNAATATTADDVKMPGDRRSGATSQHATLAAAAAFQSRMTGAPTGSGLSAADGCLAGHMPLPLPSAADVVVPGAAAAAVAMMIAPTVTIAESLDPVAAIAAGPGSNVNSRGRLLDASSPGVEPLILHGIVAGSAAEGASECAAAATAAAVSTGLAGKWAAYVAWAAAGAGAWMASHPAAVARINALVGLLHRGVARARESRLGGAMGVLLRWLALAPALVSSLARVHLMPPCSRLMGTAAFLQVQQTTARLRAAALLHAAPAAARLRISCAAAGASASGWLVVTARAGMAWGAQVRSRASSNPCLLSCSKMCTALLQQLLQGRLAAAARWCRGSTAARFLASTKRRVLSDAYAAMVACWWAAVGCIVAIKRATIMTDHGGLGPAGAAHLAVNGSGGDGHRHDDMSAAATATSAASSTVSGLEAPRVEAPASAVGHS